MKYLATLILLSAAAVQSCQRVSAEPMRHRTNLEIHNAELGIKITVKIEATTYEALQASREAILNRLADSPPKIDALKGSPSSAAEAPRGEAKGFQ